MFIQFALGVEAGEFVGHGFDAQILGEAFEQASSGIRLGDEMAGGGICQCPRLIGEPAQALHQWLGFNAQGFHDFL